MRSGLGTSIIVKLIATILGEDGIALDIKVDFSGLESGGNSSEDSSEHDHLGGPIVFVLPRSQASLYLFQGCEVEILDFLKNCQNE